MKKLVALLLSVMMCFACVSALADTYVSWYTYGDVYLSSVRSEMEADFAKLNLTINGSDANGNQQVQSDFISTALMNNDCEAIVVNLVESGAISTAQTIMNQIQAAGIPTVWFNRPVSTNNEEAANLFMEYLASKDVLTRIGEQEGLGLISPLVDADLSNLSEDAQKAYNLFKYAGNYGIGVPGYAEIRPLLVANLQAAFNHELSAAEALADFENQANEVIKSNLS